jgi:hypothetical protein
MISGIEEGQVFAVPLTKDILAIGVIARVDRKKGGRRKPHIVFAYFFGPYLAAPTIEQLQRLTVGDAVMRRKCSILNLYDGKWKIIGRIQDWSREKWPLPVFYRNDLLVGTVLIRFSDDDLVTPLQELRYKGGDIALSDENSTSGSGAVEIRLRQKLNISE